MTISALNEVKIDTQRGMKIEMKRAKKRKTKRAAKRALLLRRALITICISVVGWGCDDAESGRLNMGSISVYDVEGPRGIVRERGPWLVRVGTPIGEDRTRYTLSVEVNGDVHSDESSGGEVNGGEMMSGEMASGEMTSGEMTSGEMTSGEMTSGEMTSGEMTGSEGERQVISVPLVESGRPDIHFALIPELPINTSARYALTYDGEAVSRFERFTYLGASLDGSRAPERSCVITLNEPDTATPFSSDDDRAPEAGIQRIYDVSVTLIRDTSTPEENRLYGLVTLEWLVTTNTTPSDVALAPSALLSLRGGRARSLPLTTPRGAQRLWVRARAERGARCEAIFDFVSVEAP